MTPVQRERTQQILTASQFELFQKLYNLRNWMGELYLEFILSQEELEYIYHSEINICSEQNKDQDKRSPYLMR